MTYSTRRPAAQVVSGYSEQKSAPPIDVKFDASEHAARAGLAAAAQGFGEDADGPCVVRAPTSHEPHTPHPSTPSTPEAPASHARRHHIDRAAAIRTLLAQHRHRYPSGPQRRARLPQRLPTQWRDLSLHQRYRRATEAAQRAGGLALTLNLHPDIEAHARASTDPMRYLTLRIDRALKKHGMSDLPRAFILETSPAGRLHLHGVIIPGEHTLDTVKLALREGAGKITRQGAAPRQLDLQEVTGAAGWASYTLKGDPASIYLAQPATRAARQHHSYHIVRLRTLLKLARNWKQRAARWDQRPGPEPDPDFADNHLLESAAQLRPVLLG